MTCSDLKSLTPSEIKNLVKLTYSEVVGWLINDLFAVNFKTETVVEMISLLWLLLTNEHFCVLDLKSGFQMFFFFNLWLWYCDFSPLLFFSVTYISSHMIFNKLNSISVCSLGSVWGMFSIITATWQVWVWRYFC